MEASVEKNPLISLYKALDKSEVRRLGKWLDSPVHNQREDVKALHAYLTGGKDRLLKTSALSKMRIWQRIFPKASFDDARLRQTFHWALKATEAFLAYEHWKRHPLNEKLALAKELRIRGVGTMVARSLKKIESLQENTNLRNEHYFRNQYILELEKEEFRYTYTPLESPRLKEISENLDVTYFIEKLKVAGNMVFQQRITKTHPNLSFIDEVVTQVRQLDLSKYPVLSIHYYGYLGLVEDDASGSTVSLLRDAVEINGNLLNRVDLRYVILMAINVCISNMNQGREPYVREAFEWYNLGILNDVIVENNLLTRSTYLNIVSIALKLQEYEWAEKFIENNTKNLEINIRRSTESFARAKHGYELKDFTSSMRLLVTVDFKHPVYNLLAKTLLLKIYYELGEYDAMDSLLDSMTTYIRRKDIADIRKDNFGNIVRLVRQLSRIIPGDRKKKAELKTQIENTSPLTEKKWLLDQLEKR